MAAIERAAPAAAPAHAGPITPISVPAFAPEDGPVFHSLFQSDRRGPVALVVSELWGAKNVHFPDRLLPTATVGADAAAPATSRPLDLFQFLRPEIAGRTRRPA
jgi:hypothetical protein